MGRRPNDCYRKVHLELPYKSRQSCAPARHIMGELSGSHLGGAGAPRSFLLHAECEESIIERTRCMRVNPRWRTGGRPLESRATPPERESRRLHR